MKGKAGGVEVTSPIEWTKPNSRSGRSDNGALQIKGNVHKDRHKNRKEGGEQVLLGRRNRCKAASHITGRVNTCRKFPQGKSENTSRFVL